MRSTNHIDKINRKARTTMLHNTIERGNHLSALSEEQRPHVTNFATQDTELRFPFPIPVECLKDITGAEVHPIGCHDQLTINERGEIIPKKRMAYDLSYNIREGMSVNQ